MISTTDLIQGVMPLFPLGLKAKWVRVPLQKLFFEIKFQVYHLEVNSKYGEKNCCPPNKIT